MLPDFQLIEKGSYQKHLENEGISTLHQLVDFVRALPYGRTPSRENFSELFEYQKGTCSTKHAFLAEVCLLNHQDEVELMVGIFLMNEDYSSKIKPILDQYDLKAIPEAHCYLRYQGQRYDFTSKHSKATDFEQTLVREQRCDPNQVGDWKPMIHQHFIGAWLQRNQLPFSLDQLWKIREECINSLSS
jgi:hypothetical protein